MKRKKTARLYIYFPDEEIFNNINCLNKISVHSLRKASYFVFSDASDYAVEAVGSSKQVFMS